MSTAPFSVTSWISSIIVGESWRIKGTYWACGRITNADLFSQSQNWAMERDPMFGYHITRFRMPHNLKKKMVCVNRSIFVGCAMYPISTKYRECSLSAPLVHILTCWAMNRSAVFFRIQVLYQFNGYRWMKVLDGFAGTRTMNRVEWTRWPLLIRLLSTFSLKYHLKKTPRGLCDELLGNGFECFIFKRCQVVEN